MNELCREGSSNYEKHARAHFTNTPCSLHIMLNYATSQRPGGVEIMPDFSVVLTHVAGTCPVYDKEAMKKFQALSEKREEAGKKLGVEIVSKFSPTRIHQTYYIITAPSKKAAEDTSRQSDCQSGIKWKFKKSK